MSALAFTNPTVQQLRRLLGRRSARHDDGLFVIEGPTLAREAVDAGWSCRGQYRPEGDDTVVSGGGPVVDLAPGVFERVAMTESPRPPLVLADLPQHDSSALLSRAAFVLVLDRVQDPGNLGTILRSAEASGADAVVLTPGSVDPYNPKTVRAAAGALFHVPVFTAGLRDVTNAGIDLVGTSSRRVPGRSVSRWTDIRVPERVGIVLGNEAAGLPDEWTDGAGPIRQWVTVEHAGRTESLNVAMAATLLAFEVLRRRGVHSARG